MARIKLTAGRIRDFACPPDKKQDFLWDTEAPGLGVRAMPTGQKSFIFQGSLQGDDLRVTIGDVRAWTLEAPCPDRPGAREEARRLRTLVDQGIDPRERKKELAEARAAAKAAKETAARVAAEKQLYTLRALCDAYTASLTSKGKTRSAAAARSSFKCHVVEAHQEIAALPAREVTALQIATMVRKVREAGKERAAGVLRAYLSAAFNAAKRAPFDASLPADLIAFAVEHNPVDAIPAIATRAGKRTLSADELKRYIKSLGNSLIDQILWLALYAGGQRTAQLLRAQVRDYDHDTQTLRLLDGKGKRREPREHLLPLGPRAAEMIDSLIDRARRMELANAATEDREPRNGNLLIFSSHGKAPISISTPGKRLAEISAALGGESFDIRDIRRTVETMLASMGVSKDIRAQLLSHGLSGVQAVHYDRHHYIDEKRTALIAWENRLESLKHDKISARPMA